MKDVNSNRAYEHIRKRILDGVFAPGDPLMTEVLAKDIGVSRTPIRDALRQLETDGLVNIRPRLGAYVCKLEPAEFRDLCGIRLALESYAAGFAARNRTEADLLEIRSALESMRRWTEKIATLEAEEPALRELVHEDVRFHIAIMTAAKNELMKKEILRLHVINRVVLGPTQLDINAAMARPERDARRQKVMASHDEIFTGILKGDPGRAQQAMADHIQELIDHHNRLLVQTGSETSARRLTDEELSYIA